MRSLAPLFHLRLTSTAATLGLIGIAATLAACKPDTGPGSVVVTYELGNSKTCAEVGVTEVQANVFRGDFEDPDDLVSDFVDCEDDGEIELDGVDPNTYEVRVIGYNADGIAIFDNLGQGEDDRRVEVLEAAESTFDAEMTARPADLMLAWRLNDGFGNCDDVGIDRFQVRAFQVGGGTVLLDVDVDCESPGLVDDPDRLLNGDLFGELGIQALAANGDDVGDPIALSFDPVGPGYPVLVSLDCTEAGCIEEP